MSKLIKQGKFEYIETSGDGETILLLHGLFGALSNFAGIQKYFSSNYNVVIPKLPIFSLPLRKLSLTSLVDYIAEFVETKDYNKVHLVGNSLGGHLALLYAMRYPDMISSMTLTGSSGLFEKAFGSGFPKRGDYNFVKTKTESTFFDPKVASKELVDDVFDIVNDRRKALSVVATAKSAIRSNLRDRLHRIKAPTLLIWGKNDSITPPFVAKEFNQLISNSELYMIDECGHAPMMEHPDKFNHILAKFLSRYRQVAR